MSELSTPRTHTTGQFEAVRGVTSAPETNNEQLLSVRSKLAAEMDFVNARLRGRLITPEQAREILGDKFFGVDSANKLYGTSLTEEAIANLLFNLTEGEALNAARLGHTISLHVNTLGNGENAKPATMLNLNKHVAATQKKKALYDTGWYKDETFANTPDSLEWRETSIHPLANSFSKNYLQQINLLVQYVQEELYKGKPLPANYEAAIQEFQAERPKIEPLIQNWDRQHASGQKNWQVASAMLANLKITQLVRPTPASIMQDITNLKSVGTNMLESPYTWTSARVSDGRLVYVGLADSDGADVFGWDPNFRGVGLGACFSRSLSK